MNESEYIEKLNQFSRTIENKSEHKKNVLINRLKENLKTEWEMLGHIKKRDNISSDIVVSVLTRVFNKLESEGIKFD